MNPKWKVVREAKNKPCKDCGGSFHPTAMEFDHLPQYEKNFELSRWASHTKDEILAEIAKCDVVCANCHRVRTWARLSDKINPNPEPKKRGRPAGVSPLLIFAANWLGFILRDGAVSAKTLITLAYENGIREDTLRRAAKSLHGVRIYQKSRKWFWELPKEVR